MKPLHLTRGLKRKVCDGNAEASIDEMTKSQIQTLVHPRENTQDSLSQSSLDIFSSPSSKQQHNTMDIFSSPSSKQQHDTTCNNGYIRKQLKSYTWVQCDNLECQKWRRMKSKDINHIGPDDKWFCHMNTDQEHSWCGASEEDYKFYDKLAKKAGVKFVLSELKNGSIVWAKMVGYCRWPAVVTDYDCRMTHDTDGDVLYYHVEFLGRSHSHNWIASKHVMAYGRREDVTSEVGKTKKKKGLKSRKMTYQNRGKQSKRTYKNRRIEEAIIEADKMLELSVDARLAQCKFVHIPSADTITGLNDEHVLQPTCCCGSKKQDRDSLQSEIFKMKGGGTGRLHHRSTHMDSLVAKNGKYGQTGDKNHSFQAKANKLGYSHVNQSSDCHNNSPVLSSDCRSPQIKLKEFSTNKMKFGSTLMDKTKEEKFKIDIEMYRKNERAFEHDVRRFMIRNNCEIGRLPCWKNVNISLFQLFLAVFERGGFEEVCRNRGWASVFREVTDTYNSSCISVCARKYFQKNLYPYELYVKGKGYQHLFKKDSVKFKPKKKRSEMNLLTARPQKIEVEKPLLSFEQGASETSDDLVALLQELEGYYNLCEMDTEAYQLKEKRGLNVTLYDESPDLQLSPGMRMADTASEFGCANIPGENAQQVPEVDFFSSDSDGHDLILHEMQALDNEMAAITEELSDIF